MNKVVLIGRLTKNPELRFTPGTGLAVSTFTIAVDRKGKKEGKQEADFIPIVVWGKQGEAAAKDNVTQDQIDNYIDNCKDLNNLFSRVINEIKARWRPNPAKK